MFPERHGPSFKKAQNDQLHDSFMTEFHSQWVHYVVNRSCIEKGMEDEQQNWQV